MPTCTSIWLCAILICIPMLGCGRRQNLPVKVTLDQLDAGDFSAGRSPPFIPAPALSKIVGREVSVDGEVWFLPSGTIILTRPSERVLTPTRVVICAPAGEQPTSGNEFAEVHGVLELHPLYSDNGNVVSIFRIAQCSIAQKRTEGIESDGSRR